ncbi:ribosome biogenesis GTPase YlqF [Halobacteriovorax sp.]|uniref:ribosome biogenesis GTPase YlqF n=1 Tax=Halobacteriovorax sp. TaxID=2020862 RepID=UPI003562CB7F
MAKKVKRSYSEDVTLTEYRDHTKAFNWFPGHMAKAMRQVGDKLKMVDIILELRDARIPLLSGNEDLKKLVGNKCRLVVLNKVNLSDPSKLEEWKKWFEENEKNYIFINALDRNAVKLITDKAREIVIANRIASGGSGDKIRKFRMMMVGLPNTGKSTLINSLRGKKSAKCGDKPGLTQQQQWIKIDADMELLDTPGIMPRRIDTRQEGMWLCATHAIRDSILGQEEVCCFVVEYLLKNFPEILSERYSIDELASTTGEVLEQISFTRGFIKKKGVADFDRTFATVLSDFRKGELGLVTFENAPML